MGFVVFNKGNKMKINTELDQEKNQEIELIENSVEWHKEKEGDNILLQYINGGESMRIIERLGPDIDIVESHHHGKSLIVRFSNGNIRGYYQDDMGNYKLVSDFHERERDKDKNGQNDQSVSNGRNNRKILPKKMMSSMNYRAY